MCLLFFWWGFLCFLFVLLSITQYTLCDEILQRQRERDREGKKALSLSMDTNEIIIIYANAAANAHGCFLFYFDSFI